MIFIILTLIGTLTAQINCASTHLTNDYDSLDLPPPCPADSHLNQCLLGYIQSFWDKTANSYGSEPFGIPPLDPFEFPQRRWAFKNNLFDFVFDTHNIKVFNLKDTTINKIKIKFADTNKFSYEADMTNPEVIAEGDFKVNLKIDELKLKHKGHFKLTLSKIRNYAKFSGIMEERNGERYFVAKTANFKPDFKDLNFEIQRNNSTGTDSIIDTMIMDLFANNAKETYKEFVLASKSLWEPIVLDLANGFFKNFPVKLSITFDD